MIHRLSGPNSSWKINKYTNPTISCHHLAWQTLQGGGYQIPSQQMFQRYGYLSPQMRVSIKWLACLKCKLLNYLICFHSVSERKLSSVRESRSCAHPCGLQDSNQLWRHKSETLPGKLAPLHPQHASEFQGKKHSLSVCGYPFDRKKEKHNRFIFRLKERRMSQTCFSFFYSCIC